LDTLEERLDLIFHGVVDLDGDTPAASGGDHVGGLFNRFGTLAGWFPAYAPAGAIDGRSGFAEHAGDTAPRAARRTRNDRYLPFEWWHDAAILSGDC
jgi:hypothetical protein